ncbi:MAG: alpha/beta fold hydrolase [Leptonema sp. (in: bacteria)]
MYFTKKKFLIQYIFLVLIFFCKTYNSKELALKYVPEGKYIFIDSRGIFVIEKNLKLSKGLTPLFLIHGFSSNIHTWEEFIKNFPIPYPIVAMDLLGFGFSDKPEVPYSRDAYLNLIFNIQNFYSFEKVILIGNSMGGELSLRYTLKYPKRVHKLVLINSSGLIEIKHPPYFLKKIYVSFLSITEFLLVNRPVVRYALRSAFYDPSKVTHKKVDFYYLPLKTEGGTLAHKGLFLSNYQKLSLDELKTIQTPTLILWGLNDPWIPLEHAFLFYQNINNSKLILLPDTGHIAQEESPEQMIPYVISFIKE